MCFFFQMDPDSVTVVLEDDGTVIDSDAFFKKLPAQTVLVFLRDGEKWGGGRMLLIIRAMSSLMSELPYVIGSMSKK